MSESMWLFGGHQFSKNLSRKELYYCTLCQNLIFTDFAERVCAGFPSHYINKNKSSFHGIVYILIYIFFIWDLLIIYYETIS